jgi:hypothetical protein
MVFKIRQVLLNTRYSVHLSAGSGTLLLLVAVCLVLLAGKPAETGQDSSIRTLEPHELWRLPGYLNGQPIGNSTSIVRDDSGRVFMFDVKKSTILVIRDRDGVLVDSFGQPGEGPGDINRGQVLFWVPPDKIGVVESLPAALNIFSASGEYLEKRGVALVEGLFFLSLSRALSVDRDFIVQGTTMVPNSDQQVFLSRIDQAGMEIVRFFTQNIVENGRVQMHEMILNRPRWVYSTAGLVYVSTVFNQYQIEIYSDYGEHLGTINQQYKHLKRSKEELNNIREAKKKFGRGGVDVDLKLSDYHRDIEDIFGLDDGRLLVLTSRGARDPEPKTLGVFDVFEGKGTSPTSRIRLVGEGHPLHDRYIFDGDRLFVITDALPPQHDGYSTLRRDLPYMTVICYDISDL